MTESAENRVCQECGDCDKIGVQCEKWGRDDETIPI